MSPKNNKLSCFGNFSIGTSFGIYFMGFKVRMQSIYGYVPNTSVSGTI